MLRPRSPYEACDLGLALVRHHARSLWRCFAPVLLAVALLAMCAVEVADWLPVFLIFWLKPWMDRTLLFVLSRAVFGQATHWSDLWAARRMVWGGQFFRTLLWRRFSPWRAYTQPIEQLEGQTGSRRRKRTTLMLKDNRGAATALQVAFAHAEAVLLYGLLGLVWWMAPEDSRNQVMDWLLHLGNEEGRAVIKDLLTAGIYTAVVLFLEPFYVAAGFAMYLNRRVALEAWDVEQEFRRAFA
ncbi:hypothetical protein DES44_0229 [Roseateles depolymerans]|nr:hypothetical protein DES44_0229 [Roseateles depolymerans]